jgi:hypothetical protein
VTTYAGLWSAVRNLVDGQGTNARFGYPVGIAVQSNGIVFVGDGFNNAIRMISTTRMVTTIAGSLTSGQTNGFGTSARFNFVANIALTSDGTKLYAADQTGRRVRLVDSAGYCPSGQYSTTSGTTSCSVTPAGYYKPRLSFSDNYYVCDQGYYSVAGSTACTACSYAAGQFGSSACVVPTGTPAGSPTAAPTANPSEDCPSGTYVDADSCVIVPAGKMVFNTIVCFVVSVRVLKW